MTVLVNATFATSAARGITVSVTRHYRALDAQATWAVTVKEPGNIILLRKFTSLDAALGFASGRLRLGTSESL